MATICPRCGMLDDRPEAEADGQCPHCGVVYAKVRHPSASSTARNPEAPLSRLLPLAIVGVAIIIAAGIWGSGGSSSDPAAEAERQELQTARQTCIDELPNLVTRPSTLSVSRFNTGDMLTPDGNRLLNIPFTSENDFGVEMQHDARCQTTPDGRTLITINTLAR